MAAAPLPDGGFAVDLPAELDAELISLELWQRRAKRSAATPEVLAGGRALRLHPWLAGRLVGLLTERAPSDAAPLSLRLPAPTLDDHGAVPVRIHAWR